LRSGEGEVIGDLDFALIDKRKAFMDATGHYSRLNHLLIDPTPSAHVRRRFPRSHAGGDVEESAISLTDPREASLDGGAV
jgi:aliphatic nitrilase